MALNHEFWRGFQEELLGRCNWEGIKETRRLQRTLGKNACQMLMAVSAKPLADAEEKPPQHKERCGTCRWWVKEFPERNSQLAHLRSAIELLREGNLDLGTLSNNESLNCLRACDRIENAGRCHHDGPQVDEYDQAQWPQSRSCDWCGRWEAKDPNAIHYADTPSGEEA